MRPGFLVVLTLYIRFFFIHRRIVSVEHLNSYPRTADGFSLPFPSFRTVLLSKNSQKVGMMSIPAASISACFSASNSTSRPERAASLTYSDFIIVDTVRSYPLSLAFFYKRLTNLALDRPESAAACLIAIPASASARACNL